MGFGLITIGYFAVYLMSLHTFGFIFHIAGYLLISWGALRLRKYGDAAKPLSTAALAMVFISAANGGLILAHKFGGSDIGAAVDLSGHVFAYAGFAFNAVLLWTVRAFALETEVRQIAVGAVRNFFAVCLYYIIYTAGLAIDAAAPDSVFFKKHLTVSLYGVYLIFIVLNIALLISAYAKICDENDADMPEKESKFDPFRLMKRKKK